MKIRYSRVYEIDTHHLDAKQFILLVNSWMIAETAEPLTTFDISNAVSAAAELYDQGDLTDLVNVVDDKFEYIDCANEDLKMSWAERVKE